MPSALLEPVDRADVRMIERGKDARLAREAGTTLGIDREVLPAGT